MSNFLVNSHRFPVSSGTYTWDNCADADPQGIYTHVGDGFWIRNGLLVGKKITVFNCKINRIATGTAGTLICKQHASDDSVKSTSSTVAVSSLAALSDPPDYDNASTAVFTFSSPAEIAVDDMFLVTVDAGDGCKYWATNGVCDDYDTGMTDGSTDLPNQTSRGSVEWTI